ncbi:hypothetical protein HYFRA_00013737 [Hymenoscyphus fraxineus]|uniref:Uncharacterized protein n=1 Tax=Hymenoscyphus fraxineus TaxID=746836 RepID=A0A9N9Q1N7_9HELO|nr:hypothetical protein HYFRA_00013737 [Hymenoscyphus fraxineus]
MASITQFAPPSQTQILFPGGIRRQFREIKFRLPLFISGAAKRLGTDNYTTGTLHNPTYQLAGQTGPSTAPLSIIAGIFSHSRTVFHHEFGASKIPEQNPSHAAQSPTLS